MKTKKAILFTLCIGIIMSLFSLPVSADPAMAEYTELASGFELTIAEPVSGDSYQLWVGKKGITEDDLASISDEDEFMEMIGYVDFAMAKNTSSITFKVDLSHSEDYGYYAARLIRSGAGDDIEDGYYTYKYVDPTLTDRAMEAFMAVMTNEEFSAMLTEFSTSPNDFFTEDNMGILADSDIASGIGAYFSFVRDLKYAEDGSFATGKDIVDCAGAAYALGALLAADTDEAADRIAKYGSFITEYFPTKANTAVTMKLISAAKAYITDGESLGSILTTAKTYGAAADDDTLKIFDSLKAEIKSKEDFEPVIKWSAALGKLLSANRAEIEQIISDNDDLFGIDTSADAHYGISLAKVAQCFDTERADTLYGKEAFGAYYDSIVKAIYDEEEAAKEAAEEKKQSNKKTTGGTGGKTVYVKPAEAPEVNTETIENTQPANNLPFTDIADCAWAHEYIKALYDKGIVSGVSADSYEPNRAVTRAEFVKMLVVAFSISGDNEVIFAFDDVTIDMWSYPYIETAYRGGIVSGMSKSYFGASETITRQDAAVMIARVIGASASTESAGFTDMASVSDYAKTAVSAVSEIGIMNGTATGSFEPMGVTTRAQAATIIARAIEGGIAG